ncbi:MAG: membrane protein insertion efficiency factor YidD [Terriglobales bacterium]
MSEPRQLNPASTAAGRAALALVRAYQRLLSPLLPPACRFYPTCSEYAAQAVMRYGAARGLWMAACRLARCHPFHPGGYDPVEASAARPGQGGRSLPPREFQPLPEAHPVHPHLP